MKIAPKISVPLKGMADADWVAPLKIYFFSTYGNADAYAEDIRTLNMLRQNCRGASNDTGGRKILFQYYKQLELLELRIPVNEGGCRINFTWQDAFSKTPTTQHSLAYEKASLLFNIAAINSHIAAEAEDLKSSYKAFQMSAGLFQFIFDKFLHAPSTDLTQETVKALSKLMLAQGQEAFVETLISNESSKPSLTSKLAKGASKLYENASELLQAIFNEKAWGQKAWYQYSSIKSKYYLAMSHYLQSQACESSSKYGEAIAHLRIALTHLQELATWTVPAPFTKFAEDISNLTKNIQEQVATLEKDNDFIYHDTIPNTSSVGEVTSMEAAKAIPYVDQVKEEEDPDKAIFKTVIPLNIHKQTSLYSEEKAKILRAQDENIEIANEELASALEFLKLPGELRAIREEFTGSADITTLGKAQNIDPQVNDWASQVAASAPLESSITELENHRRDVYNKMKEIETVLKIEEADYEESKRQYRDKWTQASSSIMNSGLYDDVTRIKGDLANSTNADNQVHSGILLQKEYLDILRAGPSNSRLLESFRATESQIGSGNNSQSLLDLDTTPDSNLLALVDDCSSLISTLEKLKSERANSFAAFKQLVHEDDISTILVLNQKRPDIEESLFKDELAKFDPHIDRFTQMKERQKDLLKQVTFIWKQILEDPAVRNKKKSRDETSSKRDELIEKYHRAYAAWKDFESGFQNGLAYYRRLNDFTVSTLANARDLVVNRREEAAKIRESLQGSSAQDSQDILREQLSRLSVASSAPPVASAAPAARSAYSTPAQPQIPQTPQSYVPAATSQPSASAVASTGASAWDFSVFDKPNVPPKPESYGASQTTPSPLPQQPQHSGYFQQQPQQQQQQPQGQQYYSTPVQSQTYQQQQQYAPPPAQPAQQQYQPQQYQQYASPPLPPQPQYQQEYAPRQQYSSPAPPPPQQYYQPPPQGYAPAPQQQQYQPQYQQQQYQQQQQQQPGQKDYSSLPPPPPPPGNTSFHGYY